MAVIARLFRRKYESWKKRAQSVPDSVPVSHCNPTKALLVRSEGDEVTGALSAAYMVSWLRVRPMGRAEGRFAELARMSLTPDRRLLRCISPLLAAYYFASFWASCMVALSFFGIRKAFGSDLARDSLFIQVLPEPMAPGKWTTVQTKSEVLEATASDRSELAHSSYAHPETQPIGSTAAWISSLRNAGNVAERLFRQALRSGQAGPPDLRTAAFCARPERARFPCQANPKIL
jgi:hypothetical protein